VNPTNDKVIEVLDSKDEEAQKIVVGTAKAKPEGKVGVTVYQHYNYGGWKE